MLSKIIGSVVGTKNDRELKRMRKVVSKINAHEATIQALSDEQLQQKTAEFKERHQQGESLDALYQKRLPSAAKPRYASMACATTTCSSSVVSPCTKAKSPR